MVYYPKVFYMEYEKITLENEKEVLKDLYPMISFEGKVVKFNPFKHEMEKGEAVCCLAIDQGIIKKGVVQKVEHSKPNNYPIYTIGGKTYMYHRVWPNVEDAEKHEADKKAALSKLTKKDKLVLGL